LRPVVVAGIGGLVLGHIIWLIGISLARGATTTHAIVLLSAALVFTLAAGVGTLAWQRYQRKELVSAAFLAGLPALPVILTIFALAATYL
jgi:hypothetical protein